MSKFQKDLTQGNVAKHLLLFSLPFLAANFLQALYNMADMFFVGRYDGAIGATAVGVGGNITFLLLNLISGLAVGGTVLIAQLIGAGRQEKLGPTVGTIFTLYGLAAIVMTIAMLLLNPIILKLLVSNAAAYGESLKYLNICTIGTFFIFGYNAVSAVLRGMGDSKHPLIFVSIAAALNIGLDALFCGPFHWGAAGAAYATVISQGVSLIMSVLFLRKKGFLFDFHPKNFRIDKAIAAQLLKIGLPTSIGGTVVSLSFVFINGIANSIAGIVGNTAVSITSKVNTVAILPAFAMQAATASMGGQNLGAGKHKRALHTCLTAIGLTLAITLPLMVLIRVFTEPIIHFFIGTGEQGLPPDTARECVEQTIIYIRSISWDYLPVAGVFNIIGLAMAAGHTRFSSVMSLISSLLFRVPAVYLLGKVLGLGLMGMGFAVPLATFLSLMIDIGYVVSGKWKHNKVKVN